MSWAGGPLFAQESLLDADGRRIFWAWVFESRSRNAQLSAGWAGVMSLPRVLSLGRDDTLLIEPAEELQILRRNYRRQEGVSLADGAEVRLEGIEGDCLELALEVDDPSGHKFGVVVRCSPDSEERTVILFDGEARTLQVDTSRSSLSPEIVQPWPQHGTSFSPNPLDGREDVRVQKAPFELAPGEPLRLRIFLDRSILEVFANSRQCLTQRIYPTRGDSMGVRLFSAKGRISVRSMEAWDIAAANPW
jgi:sucrose-6-phosphate hydrolase SacC (GH32 family)